MQRSSACDSTETAGNAAIGKVIGLLGQAEGRPLSVADLVRASGVSERSLRAHFRACFGVGPHRYLQIRRLHLIRTALVIAATRRETVAGVARRFGYADAGRMAADYFGMFGEYPHQTLERRLSG